MLFRSVAGVQGIQGIKGDTGNGFSLAKIYPSIAVMNADFVNALIPIHSFVLINSQDADNGKLFVKDATQYSFQAQLSGVKGDKGDTGAQGIQGIAGQQGIRGVTGEQGLQGIQGERGIQGVQGLSGAQGVAGVRGLQGERGATGEGVTLTTGTVTIGSALSSRSGAITSSVLQKQGIFTRLSMTFNNGNVTQQAAGARLIIGVLPVGFRPDKVVHTLASDNGGSNYPRHAILIDTSGNITWIPQSATGFFTMNFAVVF